MADLERFKAKVKEYRLLVRHNQGDLAIYMNLDYTELSNRLNATKNARLSHENVRVIVRALAEWGAITTRGQAEELLDMVACPYFDEVDWQAKPLSKLVFTPIISATIAGLRTVISQPQSHSSLATIRPNPSQIEAGLTDLNLFASIKMLDLSGPKHNLPAQVTSFIGRQREITQIKILLEWAETKRENRLLTLSGAGGSGKTRLALQVAAEIIDYFPDGVWLVDLAPLLDPAHIPPAISGVLGLPEHQNPAKPILPALKEYLGNKKLLLVLDNCEHLIEGSAQLVTYLIRNCPGLQIMATSREALNIAGETIFVVPSLTLPSENGPSMTFETLDEFEAVRLFLDRALSVNPKFKLTNHTVPALLQILRHLDGIPLAIELAAARTKILTLEQINTRLADRFKLLIRGDRTALPRQQTLRALIDWSYDLLSEAERILLRRLSVFAGNWSLAAAELVGSGKGIEAPEVLDLLSQLVNKSMVVVNDQEQEGEVFYHFLETIREYAQEELENSGERQPWEKAVVYLELVGDRARETKTYGEAGVYYAGVLKALTHLPFIPQIIKKKVDILIKQAEVSISNTSRPQQLMEQLLEVAKQLHQVLEDPETELDRLQLARLHYWLSRYSLITFNYPHTLFYSQKVLEAAQALNNAELLVLESWTRGRLLLNIGEFTKANEVLIETLPLLQKAHKESDWVQGLMYYGWGLAATGHYPQALAQLEQARIYCLQTNNLFYLPLHYLILGLVHHFGGNLNGALEASQAAVKTGIQYGDHLTICHGTSFRSLCESYLGQHQAAAASMVEAQQLLQEYGGRITTLDLHTAHFALTAYNGGEFEQAIELARQTFPLARQVGGLYSKGIAERVWGQALTALGPENYQEADNHLAASVKAFESGGAIICLGHSYIAWGDLYRVQGKQDEAKTNYQKANVLFNEAGLTKQLTNIIKRIVNF